MTLGKFAPFLFPSSTLPHFFPGPISFATVAQPDQRASAGRRCGLAGDRRGQRGERLHAADAKRYPGAAVARRHQ